MRRRFKTKKKYCFKLKYIINILIICLIYHIGSKFINKINLVNSNEKFITYILNDSNHYIKYNNSNNNLEKKIIKLFTNIDLKNPVSILKSSFYSGKTENFIYSEENKTVYIENPKPINIDTPRVYIYNSHQLENYKPSNLNNYELSPNVLAAAYFLKEKLESYNIPVLVEETNMTDFMNSNNWQYNDSYLASRYLIKDTLEKYNNLDLLIDLHRDSIKYDNSTITMNDKKYARVLFVVGTEYDGYKANLELANKISLLINNKYFGLSRGVITKSGPNVNGVYNQDMSQRMLLIECGGYENTIDEVKNTIEILSEVINIYLEG